jgi:HK97 family phage prohead protease
MRGHAKAVLVETKADENGVNVYTFRATSEAVDRQGEVVTLDGWDLDNYEANPVILDSHNYTGIEAIVGRALPPLRMTDKGIEADVVFNTTPKGRLAEQLVAEGNLRAVSVGFRSLERARGSEPGSPVKHTRKELLEISVVPVPANSEALRVRSWDGLTEALAGLADEVKAGRVLSKKNETLLRQAAEALTAVLSSLGDAGDQGAGAESADTKGLENLDVSAFATFLQGKED